MLEARCPKCGYHCYGWALTEPEHQICPKCGARLEISQADPPTQGEKIITGPEEQRASNEM